MFTPNPFVKSGLSYSEAMDSIPSKLIYVRGDTYGGSNGTTLSSSSWANAGSLGGNFSGSSPALTWETSSQNGLPGVKNIGNGAQITTGHDYNLLPGTAGALTIFAVEKRNGSQGTPGFYGGSIVSEQGGYSGYVWNTRTLEYYLYGGAGANTGLSYTDNVPFVCGIRMNTSGHLRVNLNGNIYSDTTSRGNPSASAGQTYLLRNLNNTSNNYGYEYIVTKSVLSDIDVDKIVIALKSKWGIA